MARHYWFYLQRKLLTDLKQAKVRYPKTSRHFLKTYSSHRGMKVELNLSNYSTKSELKKRQVLIHHHLKKTVVLASLKSDMCKLDSDELKPVPTYLKNLKSKRDNIRCKKTKNGSS